MDYEVWVIEWFKKHTSVSEKEINENKDENYFDLGYIDSFEFIELISDIEELGIELENEQFEDRRFSTISCLAGILSGYKKKENK